MHTHETLARANAEWPNPKSPKERREDAIRHLEERLGVEIDRADPMLSAVIAMERAMQNMCSRK